MDEAKRSVIYVSKTNDRKDFLKKIFEVFEARLSGRNIFLKPNIVSAEFYPTTTHPEIFEELVRLIKLKVGEPCNLSAGDASAADLAFPGRAIRSHPLFRIAREHNVSFYDFYDYPFIEEETGLGMSLKYSSLSKRFDFIISLPVLKSHINVLMTSALKNQFGWLERKERIKVHFKGKGLLDKAIVGINILVRSSFFVVDFIETLLDANEKRHGGKVHRGGYLFAGEDPVALDFFGFSLLKEIEPGLKGRNPEEICYLGLAYGKGLGNKEYILKEI